MNEKLPLKNLGGRPYEYDRNDVAKKLLEWCELDSSINLCSFCAEYKIIPQNLTKWAIDHEGLSLALQLTKTYLGARREIKLSEGKLHLKAYDLNAATYDYFLKDERRDEKYFDHDLQKKMAEFLHLLKKEMTDTISDEVKSQMDALMSQITKLRENK